MLSEKRFCPGANILLARGGGGGGLALSWRRGGGGVGARQRGFGAAVRQQSVGVRNTHGRRKIRLTRYFIAIVLVVVGSGCGGGVILRLPNHLPNAIGVSCPNRSLHWTRRCSIPNEVNT